MAVLAGAAFGAAGAAFQVMLRNPLASPDVLGITLGASAAAVFASSLLGGARHAGHARRARRVRSLAAA